MEYNEFTSYENVELPSLGKVYDVEVNPKLALRSMTTMEEMKRQSPTDTPYKAMADLIESCLIEKPGIKVYDMCIGDYQYLLHRLRVVTHGDEYKMFVTCPNCRKVVESTSSLDSLKVFKYDDSILDAKRITLPVTGKVIELKFQTPRDLDTINYKVKEMQKLTKLNVDYSLLFSTISLIKTIDGQIYDPYMLEELIKSLNMRDVNYINIKGKELNEKVGVDNSIIVKCNQCGTEVVTPFLYTQEFFRPSL